MPDTLLCCLTQDLDDNRRRQALTFCYSASRIDGHSIGWMPRVGYDKRHEWGDLLVLFNNDDLVGFCMMSKLSTFQELRCLQIWVRPDARMILHGRKLIDTLNQIANERGALVLRLWCAEDLPANLFWKALGFRYRGWRYGHNKTGRRHALWMRRVAPPINQILTQRADSRARASSIILRAAVSARPSHSATESPSFTLGKAYKVASAS